MQLRNHDLSQLDVEQLLSLSEEEMQHLPVRLLNDLKEARNRLNQSFHNSSHPHSSDVSWEKDINENDALNESKVPQEAANSDKKDLIHRKDLEHASEQCEQKAKDEPRKPVRQHTLAFTDDQDHLPESCVCCHQPLNPAAKKVYTAFETVDIEWPDESDPSLRLNTTKHIYYEIAYVCGHSTKQQPYCSNPQNVLPDCSQWRLVSPGLASLINYLAYRTKLSRASSQEFLHDWLGQQLRVGTINNTLNESGAATMHIEDELIQAVVESQRLHVDVELTLFLWLWVFSTSTTVYWIAYPSELIENILVRLWRLANE